MALEKARYLGDCLDKNIEMAVSWLINSGIQNISGEHAGGFNGWYDIDKKSHPFVYSEITGYGITTLLFLNSLKPDNSFIQRAELAANWIINKAMHPMTRSSLNVVQPCGARARAYNTEPDHMYSFESNMLLIFDNGMILPGLVGLYHATRNERYLKTATRIGNFLLSMQKPGGLFYASYDANNNTRIDSQDKWSSQSGSYHAKLAIGLLDLYNATKDETYRQSAVKICNASLAFQENGRFVTQQNEKSTHMHPHCYSAEGLLYAGAMLGENNYIASALDAVNWSLDNQLPNGGVPCKFIDWKLITHERSDTLAQVLRLALYFRNAGMLEREKEIEKLRDRLLQFQKADGEHAGGFFYGTELDGTRRDHINSWCSFFAVQALIYYNHFKNRSKIGLNLLI